MQIMINITDPLNRVKGALNTSYRNDYWKIIWTL